MDINYLGKKNVFFNIMRIYTAKHESIRDYKIVKHIKFIFFYKRWVSLPVASLPWKSLIVNQFLPYAYEQVYVDQTKCSVDS